MNAKILYAATVALALASSLAVAQESQPLTRAEVNKAWAQAKADGTLRKNDYDYDANDFKAQSTLSRDQVIVAVGYPLTSENISLDAAQWRMWRSSHGEYQLNFSRDGHLTSVTGDDSVTSRVVYQPGR